MQTKIKPLQWQNLVLYIIGITPQYTSTADIAGMSHDMNVVTQLEGY